ncbi:MAG: hypothetical protein HRU10_12815 [Opitutales bacterium]|nr:hypothetical protein [Opitutales bacterium]
MPNSQDCGPRTGLSLLGLSAALRAKRQDGWDWLPFFDALLIVLFCVLWHEDFVFMPGVPIALSETEEAEYFRVDAVLTIVGDQFFFESEVVEAGSLVAAFEKYFETDLDRGTRRTSLLLKLDRDSEIESLMNIVEQARAAGFEQVILARRPRSAGGGI